MKRVKLRAATLVAFVGGALLTASFLPAGVVAAPSAKDVFAFITDPDNNSRKAKVDQSGALRVASTGTVNVTNLPATQQVAGTVSVGSLPAIQPFQAGDGASPMPIEDGEVQAAATFSVPAGKRLVIKHVSGLINLPVGQEPFLVFIDTQVAGSPQRHRIAKPERTPVETYFQFGEELTLFADPGATVRVVVNRFGSSVAGEGSAVWAVSGYLTNA